MAQPYAPGFSEAELELERKKSCVSEKFEKNIRPIVCLEEDLDTSLESANFSKIPRTGATVKVRL